MTNQEIALKIAKLLDERKASNIVVLDVANKSSFADYLIIATGNSDRQLRGLISEIDEKLAEDGILARATEGDASSGWVLMDYGDSIVNIFSPDMRTRYNLDKVWGDCPTVEW